MASPCVHRLLRPTLLLARGCGAFPLGGVWGAPAGLRLSWGSPWTLHSGAVWCGLLFTLARTWTVHYFREPDGSLSSISNSTLVRCAVPPLVVFPLLLQLAARWTRFVDQWQTVEARTILHVSTGEIHSKIRFYTVFFAALRFVFFVSNYAVTAVRVVQCISLLDFGDFVHTVFYVRFPQVFMVTPAAHWKNLLLALLELICTWSWLCAHLVVLDLSLVLREKFKTFNDHLGRFPRSASAEEFWLATWREYCRLRLLLGLTDRLLGPVVLACVALETINVILFIYMSLTRAYTLLSYAFFAVVFSSHLSVDVVTLAAMAAIFDLGRRPLRALQAVPSAQYSRGARRLYARLRRDPAGLTGCGFFLVSQTTLMSIFSALVTYEVVLVQFGALRHDADPAPAATNSTGDYCHWIINYLNNKMN